MMFSLLLALSCKDQATLDENDKLKMRVADLTRTNERMEKDEAALKARLERLEADAKKAENVEKAASLGLKPGQKLVATIQTSLGDIHCTLRADEAPETVANFVQLSRGEKEWTDPETGEMTQRPLYDGTIFHRVIPEFMIQGGDPKGNGTGGPGYQFADEVGPQTVFDHTGILAMANSGPDTNGSQFFITDGTPTHLNGKHSIFGDCQNQDVTQKIANVEKGPRDRPVVDVVIKHIKVDAQ